MVIFPNAKINIGLNILRKRTDGFHDLQTVFYPIMVRDVLEIVESDEMSFTTTGIDVPGALESNICLKAYEILSRDISLPPVKIHLHKNIPVGAGLGGGSADASFFIKLINDKFGLGLSSERMLHYASQLGADCPFFIKNEPVFATGRGEKFEDIKLDLSSYFLVLIMPPLHIITADAFSGIVPQEPSFPLKDLVSGDITRWKKTVKNDFEPGIIDKHPQIGQIKEFLYRSGAIYASMSGSGSAVYGIFKSAVELPELETSNRVFYGV